jgi:hypothetical protein
VESRGSSFWAFIGTVVVALLTGASAPWWWPHNNEKTPITKEDPPTGAPAAANTIHPILLQALQAHGVSDLDVSKYWRAPTRPPDELRSNHGTLVGQRFGRDRYVVAHQFAGHAEFISLLGQWSNRAEQVVQGSAPVAGLTGSPPLHALVANPESFQFNDCFRPGTVACN